MSKPRLLVMAAVCLALALPTWAQEEDTGVPSSPPAGGAATDNQEIDVSQIDSILRGDQEVRQGERFSYDPAGRRDPFRSLLDALTPSDEEAIKERPPGLPGMLVEELRVEGIIQTPDGILAIAQGRDNLAYIIRPGTKLYNGEVKEILPNKVIFRQQVNDPKQTRPFEEVVREISD
jgi:Tfp pilus assembly protein PilP